MNSHNALVYAMTVIKIHDIGANLCTLPAVNKPRWSVLYA